MPGGLQRGFSTQNQAAHRGKKIGKIRFCLKREVYKVSVCTLCWGEGRKKTSHLAKRVGSGWGGYQQAKKGQVLVLTENQPRLDLSYINTRSMNTHVSVWRAGEIKAFLSESSNPNLLMFIWTLKLSSRKNPPVFLTREEIKQQLLFHILCICLLLLDENWGKSSFGSVLAPGIISKLRLWQKQAESFLSDIIQPGFI